MGWFHQCCVGNRVALLLALASSVVSCGGASEFDTMSPAENSLSTAIEAPSLSSLAAGATVTLRTDGTVRRIQSSNLAAAIENEGGYKDAVHRGDFGTLAIYFVQRYRLLFRLGSPIDELAVATSQRDSLGYHQVRLHQSFNGLPILNSEIIFQYEAHGVLQFVQGRYVRTPAELSLDPALTETQALAKARDSFPAAAAIDARGLTLWPAPDRKVKLAYRFRSAPSIVDQTDLVVDANTGAILMQSAAVYQ